MLFRVYADSKLKKRIDSCWLKQEIEAFIDHLAALGHSPLFVLEAARQLASFGRYAGPRCDQQLAGLPKLIRPFIKRLNRKGLHLGRERSTVAPVCSPCSQGRRDRDGSVCVSAHSGCG
jgi:hypothetical protein